MRAFIAIEIPETAQAGAAAAQERLKAVGVDASWPRPENLHLTLKFLGETAEELGPEILSALALELHDTERFRLGLEGVGVFPNPASPRVVWLGITGDVNRLVALQADVERVMAGLGWAPDGRPYTPHLTLGRIRHIRNRNAWLKGLEGVRGFKLPGFDVVSISLFRSELGPRAAVHRDLGAVALP